MPRHPTPRRRRRGTVLLGAIALAALGGAASATAAEPTPVDGPLSFVVADDVKPAASEWPAGPKGEPAPVAAIADTLGNQGDFVADQLILSTDDRDELAAVLERWHGQLLETIEPRAAGLDDVPAQHVIRIDARRADPAALEEQVRKLAPEVEGTQRVSSEQGLALLAAAAQEAVGGHQIGLNWLASGDTIRTRATIEAPTAGSPFRFANLCAAGTFPFAGAISCTQDVGAAEAWSLLARAGRWPHGTPGVATASRVPIAIIDGGFVAADPDRPPVLNPTFISGTNAMTCGAVACPFHGSQVTAAMALPDNSFGSAGVAGPVARPMLLAVNGSAASINDALVQARSRGARIVNMSLSWNVPASVGWTLGGFDALTGSLTGTGTAIFAAAGNATTDVDAIASFGLARWEDSTTAPCENSGVICVGALGTGSRAEAPFSNFGTGANPDSVDLWAPGSLIPVGLVPSDAGFAANPNATRGVSGTSFASPMAAGLAALIWTANPGLTEPQMRSILFGSTQTPTITAGLAKPAGERMINARAAVLSALGGDAPPEIGITVGPANGAAVPRGIVHVEAFASDDRTTPSVTWFVDGQVRGTTTSANLDLRGLMMVIPHRITAVASDGTWAPVPDADNGRTITLTNQPPVMTIDAPAAGSVFHIQQTSFLFRNRGDQICFDGRSFDPNNDPSSLTYQQVSWQIVRTDTGATVASYQGHNAGVNAVALGLGTYSIRFTGQDAEGAPATTTRTMSIEPGAVSPLQRVC